MSKVKKVVDANPVAKNLNKFNKAQVHRDRKKDADRGYQKHKNRGGDE